MPQKPLRIECLKDAVFKQGFRSHVNRSIQSIADKTVMLALSIRQPYAELILRGIKTAEMRSSSTIVEESFCI